MTKKYSIPDHWDMDGKITATSDPQTEFELWQKIGPLIGFKGHEFTLQDFAHYIHELKRQTPPSL